MTTALHHIANRTKLLPPLRVGIGGPVGSGKTTLLEMLCKAMSSTYDLIAITNDIYTKEDQRLLTVSGALAAERIMGVETGGCPHTAIREDASINLEAIDRMLAREGVAAMGLVVYAQVSVPLEEAALQLLKAKKAILVPFYSARSARLFLAACPRVALAKIWPCVIAEPVADALPKALKARTMVADAPTGAAMMTAIQRAVASMLP